MIILLNKKAGGSHRQTIIRWNHKNHNQCMENILPVQGKKEARIIISAMMKRKGN